MPHNAILVFCKPPVAGRVKTRLIGALTARQAAEVHSACVRDTIATVRGVRGAEKWLYVATNRAAARRLARRLGAAKHWRVVTQRGTDLGERMRNAIEEQLRAGAENVVIVGTDSPWMGREQIARALRWLAKCEVVLGPSEDGGYYLIATHQAVPKIFSGIPWGTRQVLPLTLRVLHVTRTKFRLLPRNFDLDRPEDLHRVARMAAGGRLRSMALSRWLRNHGKQIPRV